MVSSGWVMKSIRPSKMRKQAQGEHDLQRFVDTSGRMFVWCRKCLGYSRVQLGRMLLNACQPFVEQDKKDTHVENNSKFEDGQPPEAKECRIEGRKTRVTRKEFRRLKEEFHDTSIVAQRGMCQWMEQEIGDARKGGMEESENVVRECQAMAEEGLWSGWNQCKETRSITETGVSRGQGYLWKVFIWFRWSRASRGIGIWGHQNWQVGRSAPLDHVDRRQQRFLNKKIELNKKESAIPRSGEEVRDVGTRCWPDSKRHKRDPLYFFRFWDGSEKGEVGGLRIHPQASPQLLLSSPMHARWVWVLWVRFWWGCVFFLLFLLCLALWWLLVILLGVWRSVVNRKKTVICNFRFTVISALSQVRTISWTFRLTSSKENSPRWQLDLGQEWSGWRTSDSSWSEGVGNKKWWQHGRRQKRIGKNGKEGRCYWCCGEWMEERPQSFRNTRKWWLGLSRTSEDNRCVLSQRNRSATGSWSASRRTAQADCIRANDSVCGGLTHSSLINKRSRTRTGRGNGSQFGHILKKVMGKAIRRNQRRQMGRCEGEENAGTRWKTGKC